jgi:hypothetical protein
LLTVDNFGFHLKSSHSLHVGVIYGRNLKTYALRVDYNGMIVEVLLKSKSDFKRCKGERYTYRRFDMMVP